MSKPVSENYLLFENLLRSSLQEPAPSVDAVSKVMLRLDKITCLKPVSQPFLDKTLLGICGLSLTLAIVMVMLTIDQLWLLDDPLTGLFEPMGIALR